MNESNIFIQIVALESICSILLLRLDNFVASLHCDKANEQSIDVAGWLAGGFELERDASQFEVLIIIIFVVVVLGSRVLAGQAI